ncbi:MAG: ADOP family duplicated permease [Acidobacteriota bacterium]
MSWRPTALALAEHMYRLSLGLCPRSRIMDPEEAIAVFRSGLTEALAAQGWPAYGRYCCGAFVDTVRVAIAEWIELGRQWTARFGADSRRAAVSRRALGDWFSRGSWVDETRFGLRSLRKTPVVSAVAILTITLAVGLTTTTLSAVYGTVLRPLPFAGGERIMTLGLVAREGRQRVDFEALDLLDFRRRQTVFEALEGYYRRRVTLAGDAGPPQSFNAGFVTATALEHLGTRPLLGRTFRSGEDFTASIRHVVLGHEVWQTRFGGRHDVVGSQVRVDGRLLEVIGVMPAGFRFPTDEALWLPMDFDMPSGDRGSGRSFAVFGRLEPEVSQRQAAAEAHAIADQIGRDNPGFHPPLTARVEPFTASQLPSGLDSLLKVLLVAVGGILLIACANVVNLLLARAILRRPETAIRRALGAGRSVLVAQFVVESCLLWFVGAVLGIGLAVGSMEWLERSLSRFALPYWTQIRLDPPVLGACCAVAMGLALAAGLFAARHGATGRGASLGSGTRGTRDHRLVRVSRSLVTAQIAVSCALLIGAGLLFKSLAQARAMDLGFDADKVMTANLRLSKLEYPSAGARSELLLSLLHRAAGLAGVEGAALARNPPGTGPTFRWDFQIDGAEPRPDGRRPTADGVPVSHGYFDVMGLRMLRGRDFTASESRFGGQPVVVVNAALARRHLGEAPIGRRLRLGGGPEEPWLTVVGVVEDSHIGSSSGGIGLTLAQREQIYLSWGVAPYSSATFLMRADDGEPLALASRARELLAQLAPSVALDRPADLGQSIAESTWAFGLFGSLFGVFGVGSLVLSVIGLYGVTAFAVNRRRQEMGLRIALGASGSSIFRLIADSTARKLGCGILLGSILGYWLGRSIEALLFGVGAADWSVYGMVAIVLTGTGIGAALLSTRGVTRLDPMAVLDR